MKRNLQFALRAVLLSVIAAASIAHAAEMKTGTPDLKMVGPLAFGPNGILFLGDPVSAKIVAVDTKDTKGSADSVSINLDGIDEKIAAMLGTTASDILINDLAVNPASGNAYLSVSRGRGPDGVPVVVKVGADGTISELSLENVTY